MYLLAITAGLNLVYIVLIFGLPYFFNTPISTSKNIQIRSILTITILSFFGYGISFLIPDVELSNRFLHGFGGGFLAIFSCFCAFKDGVVPISKLQFFIFTILLVATLGVTNEILEFCLQNYLGFTFAISVNDTWLDLVSNSIGSIVAVGILTPFINKK